MYCKKCGKQINDTANFCPFCGSGQASQTTVSPNSVPPQTPPYQPQQNVAPTQQYNSQNYAPQYNQNTNAEPTNTLAIVGFILSFFVSIAGLIVSIIGIRRPGNRGLAIAGIIISSISIVITFIVIIVVVAAASSVAATYPYYGYLYDAVSALI